MTSAGTAPAAEPHSELDPGVDPDGPEQKLRQQPIANTETLLPARSLAGRQILTGRHSPGCPAGTGSRCAATPVA